MAGALEVANMVDRKVVELEEAVAAYDKAREEARDAVTSVAEELRDGTDDQVASMAYEWYRRLGPLLFRLEKDGEKLRRLGFFDRPQS